MTKNITTLKNKLIRKITYDEDKAQYLFYLGNGKVLFKVNASWLFDENNNWFIHNLSEQNMTKTKPAKTFKETKAECKELGFQLTRNDYDEYELVPFSELGGEDEEAVTHYNNDLSDVLLTAQNWNRKS